MTLLGSAPHTWERLTLGELCGRGHGGVQTGPFGSQLHAADYVAEGVPSIMPVNIGDNRVSPEGIARVHERDASRLAKHRLQPGDIVYSRRGDVERRALIRPAEDGWLCGTGCLRIRPGVAVHSPWLSHYLGHPEVRSWIVRHAVGATMPNLNTAILSSVPVVLPSPAEQRSISETLDPLEEKIAVNEDLVPLLRELAKAVALETSRHGALHRLGDVADVRKGLSYTGVGLADAGMPMVNLANAGSFGWLKRSGFKHYTGTYKPRHIAQPGSLLVSGVEQTWRSEIIGWPMLLPDDVGEALFSHHVFLVDFAPEHRWLRLPLWAHLYTFEARARLEGMIYGTTVATLPTEALTGLDFPAPLPDDPALEAAEALLQRAWAAERESAALVALRDALLPPLISGELTVHEAETLVGEVV